MIYFLYGPDSYRRAREEARIIGAYKEKHSALSIGRFDGDEEDGGWDRIKDFIKNNSLFDPYKFAAVSGLKAFADTKENKAWLKGFIDVPDIVLLISADGKPPKALSFLLEKPVIVYDFPFLIGDALRGFVAGEAKRRGARITEQEQAAIAGLYRNDSWGLVTELDMRALSSLGRGGAHAPAKDFIMLIKALAYGSLREKICAAEYLLESDDPAKTFNILSAFVSGDKKRQMADYDVAVKSGKLDYEAVLVDFAIR